MAAGLAFLSVKTHSKLTRLEVKEAIAILQRSRDKGGDRL
jgi:hypothetical protein